MIGNVLGPDEAFRFAQGEKVRAALAGFAQLDRPLNFQEVTDHAETLGPALTIAGSDPDLFRYPGDVRSTIQ